YYCVRHLLPDDLRDISLYEEKIHSIQLFKHKDMNIVEYKNRLNPNTHYFFVDYDTLNTFHYTRMSSGEYTQTKISKSRTLKLLSILIQHYHLDELPDIIDFFKEDNRMLHLLQEASNTK